MVKKARKTKLIDGKVCSARGVPLTRASGTMTEAEFFSFILSGLRRITRFWKPAMDCLAAVKKPYKGVDKRTKWVYTCACCGEDHKRVNVQVDHITPIGGMNGWDKLVIWCQKAFVEKEGYQVLCKNCHKIKTLQERIS